MTKFELQQKKQRLINQLNEIENELSKFEKCFSIKDKEKAFRKYSLSELNDLCELNANAFNYAMENSDKNILDYNRTASKENQVLFAS